MKHLAENLAILDRIAKTFREDCVPLKSTTTFEDLGLDSYEIVDFILQVEEQFNVVLPNSEIMDLQTMQDVLDQVELGQQEEKERC